MDEYDQLKQAQKKAWASFTPTEIFNTAPAAHLAAFARIAAGQRVLDVACGTGVVAVAAARRGAKVTGIDLTPELVAHAKTNASIARLEIDFREGDAEALAFDDASFDVVVSQFGHMFAPRADVVTREMLRVLRPGGTIAFATWPPELFIGGMFSLVGRHLPKPTVQVSPPPLWGLPDVVRERLGDRVTDLVFHRPDERYTYMSPQHACAFMERYVGPVGMVVAMYENQPDKLAGFRAELEELAENYFQGDEGCMRFGTLLTRAKKA